MKKKPSKPSWNSTASKDKQKIIFLDNFFLDLDIFTLIIAVFCDEVNTKCHWKRKSEKAVVILKEQTREAVLNVWPITVSTQPFRLP